MEDKFISIKEIYINYMIDEPHNRSAYSTIIYDMDNKEYKRGEIFDALDDRKLLLLALLTAFRHLTKSMRIPGIIPTIWTNSTFINNLYGKGSIYQYYTTGSIETYPNSTLLKATLAESMKLESFQVKLRDEIDDSYCRYLLSDLI